MKKILFLLSIIVTGCMSEQVPQETDTFKQTITHLHNENALKVRTIERTNRDNGYNKDTIIFKKALALTTKSYELLNKRCTTDDYYTILLEQYNNIDNKDTACLRRVQVSLENFNKTKDSTSFYSGMLNLMKLECDILDFYCAQLGTYGTSVFTALYKDKDTTRLSEPYTFVVIPAEYTFKYSEIIIDSTLEITLDDKKTTVPFQIKKTGGALIVTTTPTQKGKYRIKGKVYIKQKISGYSAEQMYSNSFVVE